MKQFNMISKLLSTLISPEELTDIVKNMVMKMSHVNFMLKIFLISLWRLPLKNGRASGMAQM